MQVPVLSTSTARPLKRSLWLLSKAFLASPPGLISRLFCSLYSFSKFYKLLFLWSLCSVTDLFYFPRGDQYSLGGGGVGSASWPPTMDFITGLPLPLHIFASPLENLYSCKFAFSFINASNIRHKAGAASVLLQYYPRHRASCYSRPESIHALSS